MNKLLLLTILCKTVSSQFNYQDEYGTFQDFQDKFNKKYSSLNETKQRFEIFRSNLRKIVSHNLDIMQNFTLGINQFTDLTHDEFKSLYFGKYKFRKYECEIYSSSASSAPTTLDWRNKNVVTVVKNQEQCGSCWAFSSTGAIEGAWAISKGVLLNLSEQELVDCATGLRYASDGCNGGQMDGGFKYVMQYGQCSDVEYPYTATDGTCKECTPDVTIEKCFDVSPNDQVSLKGAVAMTPVAVAIEADTFYFQSYSGGVLDSPTCGTTLDHGVLVVGYGTENTRDYWLVKNSWGETWGMNGYVKILKSNSTNDPGICGIAMEPSFPVV